MGTYLEGHLRLAACRHGEAAVCCVLILEVSASILQIADFTLRIAHLRIRIALLLVVFLIIFCIYEYVELAIITTWPL
jgi:hypothetical protein